MDCSVASATVPMPLAAGDFLDETGYVGNGRGYLFSDSVRPKCSCFKASYEGSLVITLVTGGCGSCFTAGGHCDKCVHCEGRDWVSSTDTDMWRVALVAAGASVVRTWWNRERKTWWAEVRLQVVHKESSVAEADSPEEALFRAIERATEKVPGVKL